MPVVLALLALHIEPDQDDPLGTKQIRQIYGLIPAIAPKVYFASSQPNALLAINMVQVVIP
jgi:hypothetical protein